MDFAVPQESEEFASIVGAWATKACDETAEAWMHGPALSELGVFDLIGADALDPDNQHLNLSLVLQALARAGMVGPLAETIWGAAQPGGKQDEAVRWVGAPVDIERDDRAPVPYGCRVSAVVSAGGTVLPVHDLEPAYVPMSEEAAWMEAGRGASLERVDGPYAWLAHASLTLGYCERLVELALLQTRDRQAFGKDLLTFQAPRFSLVEVYQLIDGLQLSVRDAAWRLDQGQPGAAPLAAASWVLAADVGRRVATNVHQVMGAASFPRETGVTPITGAMAVLRLGNSAEEASAALWVSWRGARPDRPSNIGGVFGAPNGDTALSSNTAAS